MTQGIKPYNTIALIPILLVITLIFIISILSCSKEGENNNDNHCPVVDASAVPQIVKDSFAVRYPSMTVNTWFQIDSLGYCAYYIQPVNQNILANFTTVGVFVSEEIDIDHDGNFEDSTDTQNPKITRTCECEIPR